MFSRQPKNPLRRPQAFETQLHAAPVRNAAVTVVSSADADRLVVAVDLKYTGLRRLLARRLKARRRKQYELEGLGLELYQQLDGHRSVADLIEQLAGRYKLTFFEARALVLTYLRTLTDRGLVVMAVKDTDTPPPATSAAA